MSRLLFSLSVLALSGAPAFAQDATVEWKADVRGWYIGVDTTIGNGCFMISEYEDGGVLRVGFNPQADNMYIVIGDDDWRSLDEDLFYDIDLQFGREAPWSGEAVVFLWDDGDRSLMLDIPFEDNLADVFVDELKRTNSVSVTYRKEEILRLSLDGTFVAMDETISCQVQMNESLGGYDPFANDNDPFN